MRRLRDLTMGDALIATAIVALVFALVLPTLRAASFRSLVDRATSEVDAIRDAARTTFERTGRWPSAAQAGEIPSELAFALGADTLSVREDYTLEWSVWEIVEHTEAPPAAQTLPVDADPIPASVAPTLMPVVRSLGGIVLRSANQDLLAELLDRYGRDASFVRNTTWTLIVRRPASEP